MIDPERTLCSNVASTGEFVFFFFFCGNGLDQSLCWVWVGSCFGNPTYNVLFCGSDLHRMYYSLLRFVLERVMMG